jgi:uncharacterized protein YfaS (alpha-2-macroglobulin family)
MDEEDSSGRPDIVEEALAALLRQGGPAEAPKAVVEGTLRAVSELAKAPAPSNWKERILAMWRKEARDGGTPSRRPIGRFVAVAAALVALNVAGIIWIHHDLLAKAHQKIRVLSTLPGPGQVDETDRFVLLFDEPVVSPADVGKPLERRPYILSPQPAGQWQWAAADRLEFVLARKLPPGRVFTLKPAVEMEALTGRQVVGLAEFRFQTRALALQSCLLENSDKTSVHFSLHFNQPVHPSELIKNLSVLDGNSSEDLRPVSLSQETSDRIVIQANRPASGMLRVRVLGALSGEGGQLALGGDFFQQIVLPARFSLLGVEVEHPGLEKEVSAEVRLSEAVSASLEPFEVRVSPPLEGNVSHFKVHPQGGSWQLTLRAPFQCGKRYTVTVPGTLTSQRGQTLGEDQSVSFDVPDRAAMLRFDARKGILSPSGNMLLDLEAVNAHHVGLGAARVHANNLVEALRRPHDENGTSRTLPIKNVDLDLPPNVPGKLAVDLKGLIDQTTGIYRVTASLAEQDRTWVNTSSVVAVTDLGITAKRHKDGYLVWVTSIASAKPVGGVTVRAITFNNQTIAEAQTDDSGVAVLAASFDHPDGPAFVITAEKERDLSFLQLQKDRRYEDDESDYDLAVYRPSPAAGDSSSLFAERPRPKSYEVMLYGERGIYRPGEAIHMTGIVRDARGAVPPPFPITIRVTRPDGREVARLPVAIDFPGQGVFHVDYVTPADGQTGEYTFTATLPGSEDSLGTEGVLVEAFVPVRLEVKAAPTKPRYEADEPIEANVSARYLFGPPGAGLPLLIMGDYFPIAFSSEKFKDFTFGSPVGGRIRAFEGGRGDLDGEGRASVQLGAPDANGGLWRGEMAATVTEPGGRSVSSSFSYTLDLDDYHIGLRLPASRIVPVDAPVKLDWVRLAPGGEPVEEEAALEYELSRVEWDWVLERVNDRPVWKSKERLIPAGKGTIAAAGDKGAIAVRCPQGGRYRLTVRAVEEEAKEQAEGKMPSPRAGETPATLQTVVEFYASDAREAPGTLVEQPEKVEVVLDRGQYVPGAIAKVLVRSPFRGTMLLTVETDRVIDQQVLEMDDKTFEMELPVPLDLRGGAFVTATVLRAVDPKSEKWLPVRASGSARLVTDHSGRQVALSLDAPAKVRPGQKIHVIARAGAAIDPANPPVVHLWAVDEGILLCTAYRTPGPLGYFLVQRPHEVATVDVFGDLMPDYQRPADIRKIGAGGGEEPGDRKIRRSFLPIRTTQAAVVWSKAVPVGPDGTISADLELPGSGEHGRADFTGELRLMAVAVAGDYYGSAQRPITVAAPLVVEASWPRFASPGDKFQVPVKLFNNTGDRCTVRLSLRATGPVIAVLASGTGASGADESAPLRAAGKQDAINGVTLNASPAGTADLGEYELLPGTPRTIWLDAQAQAMGQVSADIIASPTPPTPGDLGESSAHAEFTVRPAAPLHSLAKIIAIKAGEGLRLEALDEFLPGTLRRTVEVSGQPSVQLRSAVERLLDYPYGCVEQTSSRLYGILYAPDLLLLETPLPQGQGGARGGDARVEEAGRMIHSGILRLWSMQTRNGGMAYWPGETEDCLWPSTYVGGLLAEARRLGYAVEKEFSDNLCDYLLRKLGEPSQEIPDNLRAEMCRVLAAFGRPQQGWMNRLSEKVNDLDVAGRANLAAAFALAGRKDLALKMLPEGTMGLTVPTSTGGRITSQTAQYAALLAALMDIQSDHPWVGLLAGRLDKSRAATGCWGTTLENAMCIAALAKYQLAHKEKSEFTGTLKVEGGETLAFDGNRPARIKVAGDKPVAVETSGSGPVYLHVKAEGLAKEPPKPYDNGLEVRRRWADLAGREIDPAKVRMGDLIVAEVYFRAVGVANNASVENVAIVDALPGGVEVENTRLAVSAKVTPIPVPQVPAPAALPLAVSRIGGTTPSTTGASAPSSAPAQAASAPAPLWPLSDAYRNAGPAAPTRVEWLDDRVVIFDTVTYTPRVYRYLLRATCGGTFRLPQIQASCMYDPAFASLHGGGEVTVTK